MSPLLEQLRAAPRDRALHLVLADELQARGDPHGELISIQDAAASTRDPDTFAALRERARELYETHPRLRLRPEPECPLRVWASWERGFVRQLEIVLDRDRLRRKRLGSRAGDPPAPELGPVERLGAMLVHPCLTLLEELTVIVGSQPPRSALLLVAALRHRLASGLPAPRLEIIDAAPHSYMVPALLERELPQVEFSYARDNFHYKTTPLELPDHDALAGLSDALGRANRPGGSSELLWLDRRQRFYGVRHAGGRVPTAHTVHVSLLAQRFAARDAATVFDPSQPFRITRLLDGLAMRLDLFGRTGAPRRAWTTRPACVMLEAGWAHLAWAWAPESAQQILRALRPFDSSCAWYCLTEDIELTPGSPPPPWLGLLGLGDDELVCLSLERWSWPGRR